MSNAWRKGSTRRWRRLRAYVLMRDGYRCRMGDPRHPIGKTQPRSAQCTGRATHVHHTLGRAATGDDVRYLVASCPTCNLEAGDPTKKNPRPKKISKW